MNTIRLFVQIILVACLLMDLLGMTGGNVQAATSSDKSSIIQEPAESLPTDRIIIKYKQSDEAFSNPEQLNQMERLSQAAGIPLQYFREMSGDAHVLQLQERLPLEKVHLLAQQLMNLPEVEYAEADEIMMHTLVPNDPQYTNQWHYFESWGINLPAAWDITTGSNSIVAAVIDTGITNHADLSGRSVSGYDFISDIAVANDGNGRDNNPSDPGDWVTANECFPGSSASNSSWHGTHVAGTIGAASNNGIGVTGVNWNSKILPVRVLGKCGGFVSDIADGMRWSAGLSVSGVPANSNPAKVLNLSLGGSGSCGSTYQNAINDITAAGAVIVVAAGNSNANASGFQPASCNGVITVAATNRIGSRSFYSNFGSTVEISAPGGETNVTASNGVRSTLNTGTTVPASDSYAYYQGTSMAAPHVSGVVSLVLSRNPALTPSQILSILQNTAKAFPGGGTCNTSNCGSGIVDASAAVNAAGPVGPFPLTVGRTGTGTGTITSNPTGINCGADCSETYNTGTQVTLTATADPGSTFNGWNGGGCSGTSNCFVTMNAATSVTANFDLEPPGGAIFNNSFESDDCTLSPWSSCIHDDFDLNFNFPALVATGNQSMNILIDDNNALYVTSDHPDAETRYITSFYFDPNSIPMVNGDVHTIFGGYSGTSTLALRLQFRRSSSLYQVQAAILNDGSSFTTSSWFTISDTPHQIALDWKTATAVGANNGALTLSIDGVQQANLTGVDNDTRRIDRARLGAVAGIDTGTRGIYYFDEFTSSRGGAQPTATLTVTKAGNGSGTITSNPTGINCGADCSETYSTGSQVTLTATPDSGSTFNGWNGGGCSGTNTTCIVNLTGDTTVNADFITNPVEQADLIIQSITPVPATPSINQPVTFSVVVKNQGLGNAAGFWVDLYIDTSLPIGCGGAGQVFQRIDSLAAGASQTLTFDYTGFTNAGDHTVSAKADTDCEISEIDDNNNTMSIIVPVVGGTDLIFRDGFESCDLSVWSSSVTDGGDLSAGAPGLVGSCSMRALLDDNNAIYVTSDHPNAETRYIASFYFDPNSIPMVNGDVHTIFGGYSGTSTLVLRMQFRKSSGLYQVQSALLHDNSTWNTSSWFTITDAPHQIAFDWRAATVAGANNGGLTLWIDGVQKADKTAADNDTWRIDRAQLGAVAGIDTGTRGTYLFDEFESSRGDSPSTATLTVTKSGTGSGTVTSDPPGINCGVDCSEDYNSGIVVTLTASEAQDSNFTGWSGGGCSGTGNCVVTMNAATLVSANFDLDTGDLIFANSFEDDDCFNTQWSACVDDGGDLQFNDPPSPLKDNASMVITIDDNNLVYLTSDHPNAEARYRTRFYFDPNSIPMVSGNAHFIFYGYNGTSKAVVRVEFRNSSGSYQLRVGILNDASNWTNSAWFTITDAPHPVELDWRASTAAGANNGGMTLWIDGVQKADLTTVDNDTWRIDRARLGAVNGIDTGTRGTYYFDAFESRRQTYIGP